jgi:inner membrane transporter RhtA
LEMLALRRLPSSVFGLVVSASPAVASLIGFIILGERLSWVQWAAIACIVCASAGSALGKAGGPEKA